MNDKFLNLKPQNQIFSRISISNRDLLKPYPLSTATLELLEHSLGPTPARTMCHLHSYPNIAPSIVSNLTTLRSIKALLMLLRAYGRCKRFCNRDTIRPCACVASLCIIQLAELRSIFWYLEIMAIRP